MHVLPIALPALLPAKIETESAKLKLLLNAGVSDLIRESMSLNHVECWARFRFDARDAFKDLTVSLGRTSPEDFKVKLDWSTFVGAHYSLKEVVIRHWLQRAVVRRMAWGRELAHLSDDDLQGLLIRCPPRIGLSMYSMARLQESFLGMLARAEKIERERNGSNHRKLQAIEQAKPLLELLESERAHAENGDVAQWESRKEDYLRPEEEPTEETKRIYKYRAYHNERREGFPLFNVWGEPWPKRGRKKRTASSDEEMTSES
jgi:hypothetical protein